MLSILIAPINSWHFKERQQARAQHAQRKPTKESSVSLSLANFRSLAHPLAPNIGGRSTGVGSRCKCKPPGKIPASRCLLFELPLKKAPNFHMFARALACSLQLRSSERESERARAAAPVWQNINLLLAVCVRVRALVGQERRLCFRRACLLAGEQLARRSKREICLEVKKTGQQRSRSRRRSSS